jgi:hypothetical protein
LNILGEKLFSNIFFIDGSKIKNYNICDRNVNNYIGSYNNYIHEGDDDDDDDDTNNNIDNNDNCAVISVMIVIIFVMIVMTIMTILII